MEKLLTTILTIVLVYYICSWLFRLLAPLILKWAFGKMTQQFSQQANPQPERPKKAEPTDFLKPHLRQGQTISDVLGGEYVDYEEIS